MTHYRMINGVKQIHWACKKCLVRACCTKSCADSQLPYGLDDFPDGFIEKMFTHSEVKILSYVQHGTGFPHRIQRAKTPEAFKRLSLQR